MFGADIVTAVVVVVKYLSPAIPEVPLVPFIPEVPLVPDVPEVPLVPDAVSYTHLTLPTNREV